MINILFIIKSIFIILIFNSNSIAVVSNPMPTTTLNKIANSMSYSANNTSQNVTNNTSSTTSKLINSSKLTAGIQKSAEKFGLTIDTEAAAIVASIDTSSVESMSKALASLEDNYSHLDEDYVQTIDQDTIIYDSDWTTLTKVTGGSLNYTTNNNVFKSGASQQVRAQVYVNFKKRDIFADVDTKITRAVGAGGRVNSTGGTEIQTSWNTGTATFTDLPIVATDDQRIGDGWGSYAAAFAGQYDKFSTMKKSTIELQDACTHCDAGSYWTVKQNHIEEYNNNVNDTSSYGSIYFYGKFTTASEGAEGVGNFVLEGGFTADGASERTFVESIERYEVTSSLTAKAAE